MTLKRYVWKDGSVHSAPEPLNDPMPDAAEAACRENYKNKYHKTEPDVGFTLWRDIWKSGYRSK